MLTGIKYKGLEINWGRQQKSCQETWHKEVDNNVNNNKVIARWKVLERHH